MLKKCEADYINNKINECSNQKDMWKAVKELVLKKVNSQINEIEIHNKIVTNELQIAEELNSFFIQSVKEIAACIPYVKYENNIQINQQMHFEFDVINITELKTIMKTMNNKKDQHFLTIRTLLVNFDLVGQSLHHLVIKSLQSGTFPDILKEAYIVPIKKVPNTKAPNEIRPVNMLPVLSKLLEKVVYNQLSKYFEINNLLYETQSGFRKQHNCESLLNFVISEWKTEVGGKNVYQLSF